MDTVHKISANGFFWKSNGKGITRRKVPNRKQVDFYKDILSKADLIIDISGYALSSQRGMIPSLD